MQRVLKTSEMLTFFKTECVHGDSLLQGICKVVPMLKHHAIKSYGALEVNLQAFLSSALDGGES